MSDYELKEWQQVESSMADLYSGLQKQKNKKQNKQKKPHILDWNREKKINAN